MSMSRRPSRSIVRWEPRSGRKNQARPISGGVLARNGGSSPFGYVNVGDSPMAENKSSEVATLHHFVLGRRCVFPSLLKLFLHSVAIMSMQRGGTRSPTSIHVL
jgi:hypothetical protein